METPRLILRFRELTPNVDTIKAHVDVIERHSYVWWGWWRKISEPEQYESILELEDSVKPNSPIQAWVIDTSAERLHRANVIEVRRKLATNELENVPSYYRESISSVFAWFKFSKIEVDITYRPALEEQIGQQTLLILGN